MPHTLQDKAVLVSLTRRMWTAHTVDRDISEEIEKRTEAEQGTMKVIKELAPKAFTAPIRRIADYGYVEHCRMTVPGFVRGQNILSSALFDRYTEIQSEVRGTFESVVRDFIDIYPDIVNEAPRRLGSAFNRDDFPTQDQMRSYFDYRIRFYPVPIINDWRLDGVTEQENERIREGLRDEVRETFTAATLEIYDRAKEVLQKIIDQAKNYQGGPGASLLRDATIQNLKEVASLIPSMNIIGDPKLNEIGYEMIDHFCNIEAAELRKSEKMRDDVASAAKRILAKING